MADNYYLKAKALVLEEGITNDMASVLIDKNDMIIGLVNDYDSTIYIDSRGNEINDDMNLFDYLEKGYSIVFMSIDEHVRNWKSIEKHSIFLKNRDGVYSYMLYSKNNGITTDTIFNLSGEKVNDIMKYYKEFNAGFEIIAENSCGSETVVLGRKNITRVEYVTWKTVPSRIGGYTLGHYFRDYNSAFKDFRKRSLDLMDKHLDAIDSIKSYEIKRLPR